MKKNLSSLLKLALVVGGLTISSTAWAQSYTINTLQSNGDQHLKRHQALRSTNGVYSLLVQDDGNMCIYKDGTAFVWGTMTQGKDGAILKMQADGNLCLYNGKDGHVWSTDTYRGGSAKMGNRLVLQDDGQLVLFNSANAPIWNNSKGRLY